MTINEEHIEMTNKLTNIKKFFKICHNYNVKYIQIERQQEI